MKNQFKKQDAKGNKLPEQIGEGRNEEHIEKVLKHRDLETTVSYRAKKSEVINFQLKCKMEGLNSSFILRELMNKYTKENL